MNRLQPNATFATRALNILLWTLQILWGLLFSVTGFGKAMCYDQTVWHHMLGQVAWFSAVPRELFIFIGACEFLGGVGLLVPGITGIKPKLTSYAALGLTVIMILAALFHIARGEYNWFLPVNLVLGGVTAFIAYGRWKAGAVSPSPAGTGRVLAGLAVLSVLFLVSYAPVWYNSTHSH